MQYSPKLKRVAEQIKKLLIDNDIAGMVVLHTPGHCEYVNFIEPSYSCAKYDPLTTVISIRGKAEHFDGNIAKRDKALGDTLGMLHGLSTITMQNGLALAQVSAQADKLWDARHNLGDHTSQQEQNN